MLTQMNMLDGNNEFIIDKPIRLIELFGGYGSQHFALKYLGANVEQWKLCEWAVKSIQAYKDAHFSEDNTDYSSNLTKEQVFEYLANKGISANYNEPMTYDQVKRMGEQKARLVYNNIIATHNLVNIQQVKGIDLDIVDTDNYCYVMTYSFPCQDLSLAGLGKGMAKDSGTRSGLLWEVERILDELKQNNGNLPQVLLMENVPQVHGTKNRAEFDAWIQKLNELGYCNYWQDLNAKDYGVPQNRKRCFMVSILGKNFYAFPQGHTLTYKLVDILEQSVDEKYYLSQKAIKGKLNTRFASSSFNGCLPQEDGCCRTLCARDYKDPKCIVEIDEPIACELRCDEGIRTFKDNIMGTLRTIDCCGCKHIIEQTDLTTKNKRLASMIDKIDPSKCQAIDIYNQSVHDEMHTIKTNIDKANMTAITQNLRIRKLTPKECFRLMGVKDQDFERIAKNQSNASLYHLAGDSIVVDVLMAIFKQMLGCMLKK